MNKNTTRLKINKYKREKLLDQKLLFYGLFSAFLACFIAVIIWGFYQAIVKGIIPPTDHITDVHVFFSRVEYYEQTGKIRNEYPSLAFMLFYFLYLISGKDLGIFLFVFPLSMLPFYFCAVYAFLKLWDGKSERVALAFIFSISVLLFLPIRFDIVPTAFVLLGIYYLREERIKLSATSFAASIATKIFAIFLIPIILISMKKQRTKFLLVIATTSLIFWLPYLIDPEAITFMIEFHRTRSHVGEPMWTVLEWHGLYFSRTVRGYVFYASIILCYLIVLTRRDSLIENCVLTLVVITFFSVVWSPQYLVWILPLLYLSHGNNKLLLHFGIMWDIFNILAYPFYRDFPSYYEPWEIFYRIRVIIHLLIIILIILKYKVAKTIPLLTKSTKISTKIIG